MSAVRNPQSCPQPTELQEVGLGSRHACTCTFSRPVSARRSADGLLPRTIRGSQSSHATAKSVGDYALMATQEVTPESFRMMQRSPWWGRYMSSPTLEQQSYDTALLYNKRQVSAAGAFERHYFRNSRMGQAILCIIVSLLMGCWSLGGLV